MDKTKKTVKTFAWASFLNDLGSDMIYPIWPLFLSSVLGAPMSIIGLIDGLGDAIVSISQAVSGYFSDKFKKRKIFIWLGYLCGGISRIGYAFSSTWQHIIPFRILDRAGKMRGAPRDAMIADLSTNENRGKNFGILRTMDNLGAVFGILIAIFFFSKLGYRNLFLLAAIPSIIGTILILTLIKEQKSAETKIFKGIRFKDLSSNLKLFFLLSAIFALGSFSYSFLLIFANQAGFKTTFVPVLYLLFTAIASLFSLPFGILSDKIGRKKVLILSYILWGIVCLGFIFFHSKIFIAIAFIFYGMHKGALDTVQKAFVSELANQDHRASILGGFQMIIGIAALPASLIAGLLWDNFNSSTPFFFSLFLTMVSVFLLMLIKFPQKKLNIDN